MGSKCVPSVPRRRPEFGGWCPDMAVILDGRVNVQSEDDKPDVRCWLALLELTRKMHWLPGGHLMERSSYQRLTDAFNRRVWTWVGGAEKATALVN